MYINLCLFLARERRAYLGNAVELDFPAFLFPKEALEGTPQCLLLFRGRVDALDRCS